MRSCAEKAAMYKRAREEERKYRSSSSDSDINDSSESEEEQDRKYRRSNVIQYVINVEPKFDFIESCPI